jgi:hypothetical protein
MVDLGSLFDDQKLVRSVMIDSMEINVPPKANGPISIPVQTILIQA